MSSGARAGRKAARVIVERVRFPEQEARLVRAAPDADAPILIEAMDVPARQPVIVVNGGTEELPPATAASLGTAMASVAAVTVEAGAVLVTGATDAGVFAILGEALGHLDGAYVCLGVAPASLTTWPGKPTADTADDLTPLEPHHTHFVAVETPSWGGETRVMMNVVMAVSAGMPTVAMLAGGGNVAAQEIRAHHDARRPIIVLAGSGRLADRLAEVVRGTVTAADDLADLAASPELLDVWDLSEGPAALEAVVRRRLGQV